MYRKWLSHNTLSSLRCLLAVIMILAGRSAVRSQITDIPHTGGTYSTSAPGHYLDSLVNHASAIYYNDQARALQIIDYVLKESLSSGYYKGIARSYLLRGNIDALNGAYRKGISTISKAIPYCYLLENKSLWLATAYCDIGVIYQYMGSYDTASHLYYYSLLLSGQYPESLTTSKILNCYASMLIDMKHYRQALPYLHSAEKIAVAKQDFETMLAIMINKGLCYKHEGDTEKSRSCFARALELSREKNHTALQYVALVNLSNIYLREDNPAKAHELLLESARLNGPINPRYIVPGQTLLGKTYLKMREYTKAESSLLTALGKAEEIHTTSDLIDINRNLAELYSLTGQQQKALDHLWQFTRLRDSLSSAEITNQVNILEVRYRTIAKDKEIAEKKLKIAHQEKNIEQKNFWISTIAVGSTLLLLLFTGIYRSYRQRQKIQRKHILILEQEQDILKQKQELLLRDQEIEKLKAMMTGEENERLRIARELHDGIGGMLATVKMYLGTMRKDHPDLPSFAHLLKAICMLEDTSEEVRKTAHNLMPDAIIRHDLQNALETYCDNINATNQLRISLGFHNFSGIREKMVELMLYRIIQELVQNIIKHAQATHAEIQFLEDEDTLSIMVEDDGRGFATQDIYEGLGLQNLRFRVDAMQGYLSITSVPGKSTTIHIEFNLKNLTLAKTGFAEQNEDNA